MEEIKSTYFNSVKVFKSSDENVMKFVFEKKAFHLGNDDKEYCPIIAEAVLYKYPTYEDRTVICCSVQSGCPVGCSFCGTGKFFIRNLISAEIYMQVVEILEYIKVNTDDIKKFQIMFMSMGEPMLNVDELITAIGELNYRYPNAQLLISTSAPSISYKEIGKLIGISMTIDKVGLQFSVHESTDEARRKLIPTNTSTLRQISALGELWSSYTGRKPFFNYCVHEGNNTSIDAELLASVFNPKVWEVTLSVICEKDESVQNSIDRQLELIHDFERHMLNNGFSIRVFNPAGQDDIGGGCGQLWYFQEWLKCNKNKKESK